MDRVLRGFPPSADVPCKWICGRDDHAHCVLHKWLEYTDWVPRARAVVGVCTRSHSGQAEQRLSHILQQSLGNAVIPAGSTEAPQLPFLLSALASDNRYAPW